MPEIRDEAVMGEFLQTRPTLNAHTVINYFTTSPATFHPSALITRVVQFPDVSFYQGDINYTIMCMETDAIILRAGQNTWTDSKFERNYTEARKCNKKIGVYWFYDGRASPGEQAELLLSLLAGKKMDMEVFIDWEHNYGGRYEGLPNVVAMMQVVEAAGYRVGLYTGYYFFRANSNSITHANQYRYLKQRPLWLAWYTNNPANVLIPAPWLTLTHWQFGTPIIDWGQESKEIDMNFFNGTRLEFNIHYGETMATFAELKSNTTANRTIRKGTAYPQVPHIYGGYLSTLIAGEIKRVGVNDYYLYASNIRYESNGNIYEAYAGDKWWKLPVTVDGVLYDGWVAEIHKGIRYLTVEIVTEIPPSNLPTLLVNVSDAEGLYVPVTVELKPK